MRERAEHVGAAYRHDYVSANRYFADDLGQPAGGTAVRAGHSGGRCGRPATAGFRVRHRDWELLAEHVDLHELADGGHYFLRTRPAEAAQAVLRRRRNCSLTPDAYPEQ